MRLDAGGGFIVSGEWLANVSRSIRSVSTSRDFELFLDSKPSLL